MIWKITLYIFVFAFIVYLFLVANDNRQYVENLDENGTEALIALEKRVDALQKSINSYTVGQNQANGNLRCRLKQNEADLLKLNNGIVPKRTLEQIDKHCGTLE